MLFISYYCCNSFMKSFIQTQSAKLLLLRGGARAICAKCDEVYEGFGRLLLCRWRRFSPSVAPTEVRTSPAMEVEAVALDQGDKYPWQCSQVSTLRYLSGLAPRARDAVQYTDHVCILSSGVGIR